MTSFFLPSSPDSPPTASTSSALATNHQRRPSLFSPASSLREKARLSPLPSYTDVAEAKQLHLARQHGWTTTVYVPSPWPIPVPRLLPRRGTRTPSPPPPPRKRFRVVLPLPPRTLALFPSVLRTVRRRRTSSLALLALLALLWLLWTASKRLDFDNVDTQWYGDPPTLVYSREDLRRIWLWEIASGHYPSGRKIPDQVSVPDSYPNPGLPPSSAPYHPLPPYARPGTGPPRIYPDVRALPPDTAYPPRPPAGGVADLDVVMEHCDFSTHKYVRDCLEVLRLGGGLDNGKRVRRGRFDDWRYIYLEQPLNSTSPAPPTAPSVDSPSSPASADSPSADVADASLLSYHALVSSSDSTGLSFARHGPLEPPLTLPPPIPPRQPPPELATDPCDADHPRIYHMFWAGPFTDKPYLALMSFLFTQNLGLHLPSASAQSTLAAQGVCRPQFWLWINPSAAAAIPSATAEQDMLASLRANPWSAPFLHKRFEGVVRFRLWNTTEQLDGVAELKDEWRHSVDTLFNSGGVKYSHPKPAAPVSETTSENATSTADRRGGGEDDLFNRVGSDSLSSYDRLSVVLSDMARFVLCHRFGGTYLDADTILLRDWEELWGWRGSFAYRWSRLEKYNTAVLRMNRGSALGSFLFRTALRNGLDFHPMTVSRYTKESWTEGLLLRLPDALFDPAWLNTENYQRDRPPFPYFTEFKDFFDNPSQSGGAPQALGFDGFFKGAYSYHFHNFWWIPFDPSRNWPDLGARFSTGERNARIKASSGPARSASPGSSALPTSSSSRSAKRALNETRRAGAGEEEELVSDDVRDLPWATVLKRTFEAYVRGERPNMYGEWLLWEDE